MLVRNSHGDELVRFDVCDESEISPRLEAPLALALVAVRRGGQILVVFDRWKGVWELPGGGIEDGEFPRDAALRELREEAGLEVQHLDFVGLATYKLRRGTVEHGALFTCDLPEDAAAAFVPNDEISDVTWWTPGSELAGLDELDAHLAGHAG